MEAQDTQGLEDVVGNEMVSGQPEAMASEQDSDAGVEQEARDPLYVQKRLKQQKRAHDRELRELHSMIGELQSRQPAQPEYNQQPSSYEAGNSGIDEQIHKAVSYALQHKDMEERKAKEHAQAQHVAKQYQDLHKHLDNVSDKYDDFEDVVRGPDSHFTTHMRDAALLLPKKGNGSAAEVLYKLGKNPDELARIAKLHPLDQASELVRLSHALNSGTEPKNSMSGRELGQIKSNPVSNSRSVTEKTSVSELRKRMKSGWK